MYRVTWIQSGEEYFETLDPKCITGTLIAHVINLVNEETGDPDTVFKLEDNEGNTIFTEEDLN
ncbi:MAG: hypothetical protein KDH96_02125 [Candidatus Riesia sp.]|nr:hypothetical protein [Candidatus Riesia sp.]